MTDERAVIRYVSWRDLFPWLIILRTFRIAIAPSILAIATVAMLLTSAGWKLSAVLFLSHFENGELVIEYPKPANPLHEDYFAPLRSYLPLAVSEYLPAATNGLFEPFLALAEPVHRLFSLKLTLGETAYYLFGFLASLAVWAFAGGYITRQALVRLAAEHAPSATATAIYAGRRYLSYLFAPLYPLLGVLLIAIPIALLGLPIRVDVGVGSLIAGLFWLFVVLGSLAAVWLLAGLLFGWPLMWPAISAERDGDAFDAFSRSFSYVYGKPLHYLFYVVVAAMFGALSLAVVNGAAILLTEFGFWALAWGGGGFAVTEIRELVEKRLGGVPFAEDVEGTKRVGVTLISLVVALIRAVADAYTYSFLWVVASAIYLLLRRDVDEKEMDEVDLDPLVSPPPSPAPTPPPSAAAPPAPDVEPTPPRENEARIDPGHQP
jgi:hypothetical protein